MTDINLSTINHNSENKEIPLVCVTNYQKRKIRRIFCCLSPHYMDFSWQKIYINYNNVCFLVYYTDEYPKYEFVIRPAKKYLKIEFEQLFSFGFKCRGYREDKMLALVKPKQMHVTPYLPPYVKKI